MIPARRELERLHRRAEHLARRRLDTTVRQQPPARRVRIAAHRRFKRRIRGWSRARLASIASVDEATRISFSESRQFASSSARQRQRVHAEFSSVAASVAFLTRPVLARQILFSDPHLCA